MIQIKVVSEKYLELLRKVFIILLFFVCSCSLSVDLNNVWISKNINVDKKVVLLKKSKVLVTYVRSKYKNMAYNGARILFEKLKKEKLAKSVFFYFNKEGKNLSELIDYAKKLNFDCLIIVEIEYVFYGSYLSSSRVIEKISLFDIKNNKNTVLCEGNFCSVGTPVENVDIMFADIREKRAPSVVYLMDLNAEEFLQKIKETIKNEQR